MVLVLLESLLVLLESPLALLESMLALLESLLALLARAKLILLLSHKQANCLIFLLCAKHTDIVIDSIVGVF